MTRLEDASGAMPPEYYKIIRKQKDMGTAKKSTDEEMAREEKDDAHAGGEQRENLERQMMRPANNQPAATDNDDDGSTFPGGLNVAPDDEVQDSAGNLSEELLGSYQTVRESIEEIATKTIEHYTGLLDYKDTPAGKMPLVIRVPERSICVDNWLLVEQAQAAGREMITCTVQYKKAVSETELALTKAAHRVAPAGGRARYVEIMRNCVCLQNMLQQSGVPIQVYSHGGDRKGVNFTSNKEQNVTLILAERLGKDPDAISLYLSDAKYLSPEAMEILADGNAPRKFFEAVRKRKRELVDTLKSAQTPEEEIINRVSEEVVGWFNQGSADTGTINNGVEDNTPESRERSQERQHTTEARQEAQPTLTQRAGRVPRPSSPERLEHHVPAEEAEDEAEAETLASLFSEADARMVEILTIIRDESLSYQMRVEPFGVGARDLLAIFGRMQRVSQEA